MRDLFEEITTVQLRIRQHGGETMQSKKPFTRFSEFVLYSNLENANWELDGLGVVWSTATPASSFACSCSGPEITENTLICIYTLHSAARICVAPSSGFLVQMKSPNTTKALRSLPESVGCGILSPSSGD